MAHKIKLNLSNLIYALFFLVSIDLFADDFPDKFSMKYDLLQLPTKVGEIKTEYSQIKNDYYFNVVIEGKGIFSLMGNRTLTSQGKIRNKRFQPKKFQHHNKKRPKKNIDAEFFYDKKLIMSNYKGRKIERELLDGTLDIAVYLLQFNLHKSSKYSYSFEVYQGKKIRTYKYKKIKDQTIKLGKKNIETELFEGNIIGKEKSTHQVWISKNNYRIPIKLTFPTDLGLDITQVLVSSSLSI